MDEIAVSGDPSIAGYKQWTRVNPKPALVPARIADHCGLRLGGPHGDKYITVYVNEIGRHAMIEEKFPRFPQGSVIVKEKLTTPESTSPELLTVMIKRDVGYDSKRGDWEYMIADGNGQKVQERGKLENCQSCHLMHKDTDYVSRAYLPVDVREKLK